MNYEKLFKQILRESGQSESSDMKKVLKGICDAQLIIDQLIWDVDKFCGNSFHQWLREVSRKLKSAESQINIDGYII